MGVDSVDRKGERFRLTVSVGLGWQRSAVLRHDAAMHEEPLEEWARRREERRNAAKGKLRAVPLTSGPHRGAHIEPHQPRVIEEWNGTEWATVGVVPDLAAAKALLYPPPPVDPVVSGEAKFPGSDRPALDKGRGRHRKPSPADERNR
ncbi:DUF6087 family protein [Streptomyces sp. NPDC001606]